MKTEEEIEQNIKEILESGIELSEYMKGYVKALEWVLSKLRMGKTPLDALKEANKRNK